MSELNRWASLSTGPGGAEYAARFRAIEAAGADVHGEATFCASLVPPGSRVLDAGCGTGRVAIRLAQQGYSCVGVDSDVSMLDVARAASPDVTWLLADLVEIGEVVDGAFDLVVAAGNVIALLAPGSEGAVVAGITERLAPGGLLVAGFGLDAAHLPLDEAPFGLDAYDRWCSGAGLELVSRTATWDGADYDDGGYAVNVHRRL